MRQQEARRWFLVSAWIFIAYNAVGALISWLAALPASNGQQGNVHDVGSQALYGNGTALSPPIWLLAIWALCVLAATRAGWLGTVGVLLTLLVAVFYASAGELGELTTNTSPLTGTKWDLVLVLGWLGIAIALIVILAGAYWLVAAIIGRTRPSSSATQL